MTDAQAKLASAMLERMNHGVTADIETDDYLIVRKDELCSLLAFYVMHRMPGDVALLVEEGAIDG
jgi:hypothetical protein